MSRSRKFWLGSACALSLILLAVFFYFWRDDPAAAFQLEVPAVPYDDSLPAALYQGTGAKFRRGHEVRVVQNGAVADVLEEQILASVSSIHIVMYIWADGSFSNRILGAIGKRTAEGVQCRILVDAVGSPDFEKTLAPQLRSKGCQVRTARPLDGHEKIARNHRKLAVLDGISALTGGFGIRDTWLGNGESEDSWRDTAVLFSGPSVTDAQQAFAENWQEAGGDLLPNSAFPAVTSSGGASVAVVLSSMAVVTRAERLVQLLILSAQKRIWISNAYFLPSSGIRQLLLNKATSGVDVRVLWPGKSSDSKTAFGIQNLTDEEFLEHGVRIFEFTVTMMHSKTMLVDDETVLIGSINLDPLSLNQLDEVALVVQNDPTAIQSLKSAFLEDSSRATELKK